jgi:16S rRNA (adenine1518-N6/adenine1519-N6)-dimethyltransferase
MRAKKHFGQNFLNSTSIIHTIVEASSVCQEDTVLEIGPGKGSLTRELLKHAGKVIAVEKDADLIPRLTAEFSEDIHSGKLELIQGDIVDILSSSSSSHSKFHILNSTFKTVANIPYNITGQLLRQLLTLKNQPISITLVVQKEVAERIVCRDGKESVLSLSVKLYGTPTYIQKIPARYFTPKPDVDSAVIHIADISRKHIPSTVWEKSFFNIIKAGFAHKRKLLIRNLEDVAKISTIKIAFDTCEIPTTTRAETVSFDKWVCITSSTQHSSSTLSTNNI